MFRLQHGAILPTLVRVVKILAVDPAYTGPNGWAYGGAKPDRHGVNTIVHAMDVARRLRPDYLVIEQDQFRGQGYNLGRAVGLWVGQYPQTPYVPVSSRVWRAACFGLAWLPRGRTAYARRQYAKAFAVAHVLAQWGVTCGPDEAEAICIWEWAAGCAEQLESRASSWPWGLVALAPKSSSRRAPQRR